MIFWAVYYLVQFMFNMKIEEQAVRDLMMFFSAFELMVEIVVIVFFTVILINACYKSMTYNKRSKKNEY